MDALAKSASHRREVNLVESINLTASQSQDPLERLLETEVATQSRQKIARLVEAVEGSPELHEVLQVILAGCEPRPRHIASQLGISVREVDNRLKCLRRRATKLNEKE